MQEEKFPSTLIKDVQALENDFKYNLTLLKIREEEIKRCSEENRTIKNLLKSTTNEVCQLRETAKILEVKLRDSECERKKEKQIYESTLKKMKDNYQSSENLTKDYKERYEEEVEKVKLLLEREQMKNLAEIEVRYEKKILDLESELKTKLEILLETKNDLEATKDENKNINKKLNELKMSKDFESSKLRNCSELLRSEVERLKFELEKERNRELDCFRDYEILKTENFELRKIIEVKEKLINNLEVNVEELKGIVKNYNLEIERLVCGEKFCNIEGHKNYEQVIKQNEILRNTIKAMRLEKNSLIDSCAELRKAESKICDLEKAVEEFKKICS